MPCYFLPLVNFLSDVRQYLFVSELVFYMKISIPLFLLGIYFPSLNTISKYFSYSDPEVLDHYYHYEHYKRIANPMHSYI